MSEGSHPPAWLGQCTLESRPPTPSNASRPQAYIIDSGRKPAELSHINALGRKLSGARTSALQAASLGGGGEGEEGSNPPVHREREGRGAIPTPYMHRIPTLS